MIMNYSLEKPMLQDRLLLQHLFARRGDLGRAKGLGSEGQ